MKRIFVLFTVLVMVFGLSVSANALLVDNGDGTITDTDTGLMWLQDANYAMTSGYDADGRMTWTDANTWVSGLSYGGYTDWRLPDTVQPDSSCSLQFDPGGGFPIQGLAYNCTGSEMGYLYNTDGITSSTPGLFANVQSDIYWSGTEYAPYPFSHAWDFYFGGYYPGYQDVDATSYQLYAWAVRDGDVAPVPEPGTLLLLGSGLLGLVVSRKKLRQHG